MYLVLTRLQDTLGVSTRVLPINKTSIFKGCWCDKLPEGCSLAINFSDCRWHPTDKVTFIMHGQKMEMEFGEFAEVLEYCRNGNLGSVRINILMKFIMNEEMFFSDYIQAMENGKAKCLIFLDIMNCFYTLLSMEVNNVNRGNKIPNRV